MKKFYSNVNKLKKEFNLIRQQNCSKANEFSRLTETFKQLEQNSQDLDPFEILETSKLETEKNVLFSQSYYKNSTIDFNNFQSREKCQEQKSELNNEILKYDILIQNEIDCRAGIQNMIETTNDIITKKKTKILDIKAIIESQNIRFAELRNITFNNENLETKAINYLKKTQKEIDELRNVENQYIENRIETYNKEKENLEMEKIVHSDIRIRLDDCLSLQETTNSELQNVEKYEMNILARRNEGKFVEDYIDVLENLEKFPKP